MSFPHVTQYTSKQQAAAVASLTSDALTTVSGRLLVVVVTAFAATLGAAPITDSKGNTWQVAVAALGTTEGYAAMFYCPNAVGGAGHTFTVTPNSNDYVAIAVLEIDGAALVTALGDTNGASAASATHASGTITAGAVAELFVGVGAVSRTPEGLPVVTTGSQWIPLVALAGGASEGIVVAVRAMLPTETDEFIYTTSASNRETALVAGFLVAASAGGEISTPFLGQVS